MMFSFHPHYKGKLACAIIRTVLLTCIVAAPTKDSTIKMHSHNVVKRFTPVPHGTRSRASCAHYDGAMVSSYFRLDESASYANINWVLLLLAPLSTSSKLSRTPMALEILKGHTQTGLAWL